MMKRHISLLALPLLSIAACLDLSDQDSTSGTLSQASMGMPTQGGGGGGHKGGGGGGHNGGGAPTVRPTSPAQLQQGNALRSETPGTQTAFDDLSTGPATDPAETEEADVEPRQTGADVLAGSPQPSEVLSGHICESYGGKRCVGAPTIAIGASVKETDSGRILLLDQGPTFDRIRFNADSGKCVGVAADGSSVIVMSCNARGAEWRQGPGSDGHSCIFQNVEFTGYLSGPDNGGQFQLKPRPTTRWLQQFSCI